MTIIDQTSDPGLATMRILIDAYPGLLEFAKTAEMSPEGFAALPSSAFAWPEARRYPIHTPEHTALSMAYTKEAAACVPGDVVVQLVQAATIHGVPSTLFAEEKVASAPPEEYLLPDRRRFRIKTAADVQLAEHIFFEKLAEFPIGDRATMASNLVNAAERHSVELSPSTHKMACLTMTSTQIFRDWMRARETASTKLGAAVQAKAFEQLGNAFKNAEPLLDIREDQTKLASCVYELDKQAGLTGMYGTTLPDPLNTVFNTELRRDAFVKVGSVLQNKTLVQSLPLSFWEDALGPDIAKEIAPDGVIDIETLEQILPTLPADMKTAIETQLAAYNK